MRVSEPVYTRTKLQAENGIAAGGHRESAVAAIRMLQQGGNAVDGLVAGAFAGMVAEPSSCNLGGWGHTTVWMEKLGQSISFDHYVTAPSRAHERMFEIDTAAPPTRYGYPWTKGRRSEQGFLSPAVPGAVAGFFDAHAMFGVLPWKRLLEPAIELAEAGTPFAWYDKLKIAENLDHVAGIPDMARVLLPHGRLPEIPFQNSAGDRIETPELADTLKRIAMQGKAGMYSGHVAELIDRYIRGNGGILGADDLAAYRTRILRERPSRYRDLCYTACFDQIVYQILNMMECFDVKRLDPDGWQYRHLMAELVGVGYNDSMALYGDPDFEHSPVNGLTSPAYGKAWAERLSFDRALKRPIAVGDPWPFEDASWAPERLGDPAPRRTGAAPAKALDSRASFDGTSQVVCADRDGNMATTIYSIGYGFGHVTYVPGTGIFLNNSMKNYDPRPGRPNSIKPGKRPLFAAPSMVMTRGGRSVFAGAGSGGMRIESGVMHALVNALEFGMEIQDAIDHPRVHCQGQETVVDQRIPVAVRERLRALGHELDVVQEWPSTLNFGRICCIVRDPKSGLLSAGAAPPWQTGMAGF